MAVSDPKQLSFAALARWVLLLAAIKDLPGGAQVAAIGGGLLVERLRRRRLDSTGGLV